MIVIGCPLIGLFLLLVPRARLAKAAGAAALATFACFVWWASYGFDPPPDDSLGMQIAGVLFVGFAVATVALLAAAVIHWWTLRHPSSR